MAAVDESTEFSHRNPLSVFDLLPVRRKIYDIGWDRVQQMYDRDPTSWKPEFKLIQDQFTELLKRCELSQIPFTSVLKFHSKAGVVEHEWVQFHNFVPLHIGPLSKL